MERTTQIAQYLLSQPEPKRSEMETLHARILQLQPGCMLWFLDGLDPTGKIVSNPNIGYGLRTIHYANGKTKTFYQVGLSGNTTGISVYIMGIADKKYLSTTFGDSLGKASTSGYCIKFKTLQEINLNVLEAAIQMGFTNH